MLTPQKFLGVLCLWPSIGMLLVGLSFSVIAQEPAITPMPTNTPAGSLPQSVMRLGIQTTQNGSTYLNWTMVTPSEAPSPINSDIEWLVDNLNKSVASAPVMMPPAPLPKPESLTIRSIDIDVLSAHKHSFQIQGKLPTVLSIPHEEVGLSCGYFLNDSFDIAEGFASNLFVSTTGLCERCREHPVKQFELKEGRQNSGPEAHVAYIRSEDALYFRGATRTILWQVMDRNGHVLRSKYFEPEDYAAKKDYDLSTYSGGNYVRILPITFEAPMYDFLGPDKDDLFENFSTFKEIADLAYNGDVGDKTCFYYLHYATDESGSTREQPWRVSRQFDPQPGAFFNKLEAEIVEVIEGPRQEPDIFNWFLPEYFPYFLGLDDDFSEFDKVIHPYCGEVPRDFRAVILQTKSEKKELSRVILAFKGSEFNRSDWIDTDIPQFFGSIPEQYRFSKVLARYVEKINRTNYPLTAVGHSLGGGLAQYVVGAGGSIWRGYGFNPATLGTGVSAEVALSSRSHPTMAQFTVIQNQIDPVSNAGGGLLGNRWVLQSIGHTLGSMDLTRIQTVLPAPSRRFGLGTGVAGSNPPNTAPPLLPGFVNQQFSGADNL